MMSKDEVLSNLFAVLDELESGIVPNDAIGSLVTRLEVLYRVLGDDIPKKYVERIEIFL